MSIDSWNEDSILSRAGYKADGSQSNKVRTIYLNHAINGQQENALEVLRHLRWLIDDRGHRFPKAKMRWQEDLEYVCRVINSGLPGGEVAVGLNTIKLRMQQEAQKNRDRNIFAGHR